MVTKKVENKKNKVNVTFILDETGSMNSKKKETIEGFNEYLNTLKSNKEKCNFTLVKFNSDKVETVYDKVNIKIAEELNEDNYKPDNNTPLYDAIGKTIHTTELTTNPSETNLFIILTDGQENNSKEYKKDDIFNKIKEKESNGWLFTFLGAGSDAYANGITLGICNTSTFSMGSIAQVFNTIGSATVSFMSNMNTSTKCFYGGNNL